MHLAIICGVLDAQQPVGAQTIALANGLVERGYRITLFSLSGKDEGLDSRVDLIVAGVKPRRVWLAMIRYPRWLTQALANTKPDHTISMLSTVPATIMVPLAGTLRARSRTRRNLRSGILNQLLERLIDLRPSIASAHLLEHRAMSRDTVKTYIAISQQLKAQLQADLMGKEVPIELASITQPEQRVKVDRASQLRQQLARAWGLSSDSYWIVFPFVNAHLDGVETMLRAVKPLIEQGVDAVLLMAGPSRYTHLVWIGQLGLRDRVRFMGKTGLLQELISASDLIACPTSHDPAGWAVRPALGLSKPIITTTACGVADEVSKAGGSVLASPAQPVALLAAIRQQHAHWEGGGTVDGVKPAESPQTPVLAQFIDHWVQLQGEPA